MSTIEEIERAVERLSPDALRAFRDWFAAHDAAVWDRQFSEDVAAGKLDALAEEALAEHRAGRSTPL